MGRKGTRTLTLNRDSVVMLESLRLVLEDVAPDHLKNRITDQTVVVTAFRALSDVLKAGGVVKPQIIPRGGNRRKPKEEA